MKVFVCGAGGMLGRDVVRAARLAAHEVEGRDRLALDVTDARAVERELAQARPDVVVNCAAFTDVDGAETAPEEAMRVNADGARALAAGAHAVGASVVYPSSDYVFDGSLGRPYLETDEPNPLSRYGASKLAGETDTAAVNDRHFIVRTSWLFGAGGRNFVDTMLGLAAREPAVTVVRDQVGSPTWTGHLAEGIVQLIDTDAYGLHHMAAGGECSWYDFAVRIFERTNTECTVLSITTEEFGRPAPRPPHSVLETTWDEAIHLPDWESGLDSYLSEREAA